MNHKISNIVDSLITAIEELEDDLSSSQEDEENLNIQIDEKHERIKDLEDELATRNEYIEQLEEEIRELNLKL